MEDQVTGSVLNKTQNADQPQTIRAELIALAEKGEIIQSVAYVKKASQDALEKIKAEYDRNSIVV